MGQLIEEFLEDHGRDKFRRIFAGKRALRKAAVDTKDEPTINDIDKSIFHTCRAMAAEGITFDDLRLEPYTEPT